ncbi:MAG: hypothetical protein QOJ91_1301 [Sphingomonadales bacterium]|jgi:hypothetical protein|nr:hypothetical protein [Sphingomonadales bacterium]
MVHKPMTIVSVGLLFALAGCQPQAKLRDANVFSVELLMDTPKGPARVVGDMMVFAYAIDADREQDCHIAWIGLCSGRTEVGGEALALSLPNGDVLAMLLTSSSDRHWALYASQLLGEHFDASCARRQRPGCEVPRDKLPFMMLFKNRAGAASAVQVQPDQFARRLGAGYGFESIRVLPGGLAAFSAACVAPRGEASRIERLLPFVSALKPHRDSSSDPSGYGPAEAVQDATAIFWDR